MSKAYIVPNRAVALTIVASRPINENWDTIEDALNANHELAQQVNEKVDTSERGASQGIATLDENRQLTSTQLPEVAKGHVYEVTSLSAQLNLDAYPGDICVRKDLGKTYALQASGASVFSNWVEIASVSGGGEIGGNPPYTGNFDIDHWKHTGNDYALAFPQYEHAQGITKHLLADVRNDYGESIICENVIAEDGTVYIHSDVPFKGTITISNLSGNNTNNKYFPYCIIQGNIESNRPALLNYAFTEVSLICEPEIVLIDGLGFTRHITSADMTPIEAEDGEYTIFIDSSNIINGHLSSLHYIKKVDYVGIVDTLPIFATEGQRCYLAFNGSYEYHNGGWLRKAFVPVGEFMVIGGAISKVYTYNYNQNGVNVNYRSTVLDHLFGNQIEGLELDVADNIVQVTEGRCLCGSKIITITEALNKDASAPFDETNLTGCKIEQDFVQTETVYEVINNDTVYYVEDSGDADTFVEAGVEVYTDLELETLHKVAEENEFYYSGESTEVTIPFEGWCPVYLINNNYDSAIITSPLEDVTFPSGYDYRRKIGYVYYNTDGSVLDMHEVLDHFYIPIKSQDIVVTTEPVYVELSVPNSTKAIISYTNESENILTFSENEFVINMTSNKCDTIQLPSMGGIAISGTTESNVTINTLGFVYNRNT